MSVQRARATGATGATRLPTIAHCLHLLVCSVAHLPQSYGEGASSAAAPPAHTSLTCALQFGGVELGTGPARCTQWSPLDGPKNGGLDEQPRVPRAQPIVGLTSAKMLRLLTVALAVSAAWGDIYMHNPAGSNNRNRELNQNRNNANRLFDSQNNGAVGSGAALPTIERYPHLWCVHARAGRLSMAWRPDAGRPARPHGVLRGLPAARGMDPAGAETHTATARATRPDGPARSTLVARTRMRTAR